jgi:hypothetical protein
MHAQKFRFLRGNPPQTDLSVPDESRMPHDCAGSETGVLPDGSEHREEEVVRLMQPHDDALGSS